MHPTTKFNCGDAVHIVKGCEFIPGKVVCVNRTKPPQYAVQPLGTRSALDWRWVEEWKLMPDGEIQ